MPDAPITSHEKTISEEGLANSAAKWTPAGAVLVAMYGATIGKLGITTYPVTTNQAVAFVEPTNGIMARYVFQFLRSQKSALIALGQGGAQPNISQEILRAQPFPLPPEAEQRRIVAKLDALTARLARARAELDRVPVLAANLKAAAVVDAFSGRATEHHEGTDSSPVDDAHLEAAYATRAGRPRKKPAEPIDWKPAMSIPATWRWVSVDQIIARAQYGSSAKTADQPGVPVLRMGNIQNGKLDFGNLKYLPPEHNEFPELLLQEGDVIFNRTNSFELVGKSAVFHGFNQPVSFASYLIRVQCFAIRSKLLAYYLNSPIGRQWVASVASQQVGQANVNGTKLKGLAIPLAPHEEQVEMEAWIDNAFARADRLEAEAARARALIDRLESAILARAFRGELVPQDPDDEPASVLLDRIRAERAAAPKAKRGRRAKADA